MSNIDKFFSFDGFSALIVSLVLTIGLCVGRFSLKYLRGDVKRKEFLLKGALLIVSSVLMIVSNHLIVLLLFLALSNLLLTSLMCHKREWVPAYESSKLALLNFSVGILSLSLCFLILNGISNTLFISELHIADYKDTGTIFALGFFLIACLSQSAIWPFHKWLLSSLNSPTPVSALMHAGLINGGGILLYKFSHLFLNNSIFLEIVFIMGLFSAIIGTLWKLVQSDIKRMLACSTLGQMGFMFLQCGLGLFAAAIAHIIMHGFFKAYLFLSSASSFSEKRFVGNESPSGLRFFISLFMGAIWGYMFCFALDENVFVSDTRVFLHLMAVILGAQVYLSLSPTQRLSGLFISILTCSLFGYMHGLIILSIESILPPGISGPRPINSIHLFGLGLLWILWMISVFKGKLSFLENTTFFKKLYVLSLNKSQPAERTISTFRKQYQY